MTCSILDIVTITRNDLEGLESTATSIRKFRSEAGPDFQTNWLLIDGGSQFDSPEENEIFNSLRDYAEYSVSEPDRGIYHAMNKGLAVAEGKYVWFLNSGDEACEGIGAKLNTILHPEQNCDLIWGQAIYQFPSGKQLLTRPREPKTVWFSGPACHQATLFRREAIIDSPYDESYMLAADYELVARLLSRGASHLAIDRPICVYQVEGASNVLASKAMKEEIRVRLQVLEMPWAFAWILGAMKWFYQKASGKIPTLKVIFRKAV